MRRRPPRPRSSGATSILRDGCSPRSEPREHGRYNIVDREGTMRSFMILALAAIPTLSAQAVLPTEWIDAGTGHRVIRLSREDGTQSLYFNQNAYTADGKKLIVTTAGGGIATITLATREVKPLVAGPVSVLVAGHQTGDVYYVKRL